MEHGLDGKVSDMPNYSILLRFVTVFTCLYHEYVREQTLYKQYHQHYRKKKNLFLSLSLSLSLLTYSPFHTHITLSFPICVLLLFAYRSDMLN